MYIFLIGYLYVIVMVAAASGSLLGGGLFFVLMGVIPTWLLVWRKRKKQLKQNIE